jgi:hypothetical protein
MAENFKPLFVGGSGRSGTTIAINLLNNHSQIHSSLPREIKYLTSRFGLIDLVYGRPIGLEEGLAGIRNNFIARAMPLAGKSKFGLFQKYMQGPWWSEVGKKGKPRGLVQGISKRSLDQAVEVFVSNFKSQPVTASQNLFYELSSQQIKSPGVKYFADSTPVNMMQAKYLYQLFPNARFLNMVRDGRDVAYSVAAEKWGPNDPYKALDWWANRVLKAEQALAEVPENQRITVRLEELVLREREASLKLILNFLGVDPEEKLVSFFNQEMVQDKLHQGSWKKELTNSAKFEKKYLEILVRLKDQGVVVERFY